MKKDFFFPVLIASFIFFHFILLCKWHKNYK